MTLNEYHVICADGTSMNVEAWGPADAAERVYDTDRNGLQSEIVAIIETEYAQVNSKIAHMIVSAVNTDLPFVLPANH
ncbi:hypothetical protein SEA_APHELION_169 [Gordonia phage Aphelion]|uniref:Uncharacterized protein n=1 Tax=Gordonia phage Aphelion TaxID=2507860 RepID=A0A410TDE3_9CAUD|nr:hypothetical protein SEA_WILLIAMBOONE_174 [Gordonia phage WilliamBoone]QAU07032.1 hypothetical protein SEA_APHELION_169 [Gordonia phage Aphelion]